jgi:thiol-disulfide isomerase/thioredoxin
MNSQNQSPKSFWTLTRIGLIGSAVLLIAAIASALYHNDDAGTSDRPAQNDSVAARPSPVVNAATIATPDPNPPNNPVMRELPQNLMQTSIKLLNGKKKRFSDYSGKVLVVDLWATWCGPCRQEIPHLVEIAKQYKSKGVEVIGLTNEDPARDLQLVKDFAKEFRINYPIGWADVPMQIGLMNGRGGIPQTLIIGRDGRIRNHFIGFSAAISVPQMKAALDEAVAAE